MGKVVGLIGSASGKVGNVVYAVSNGIQIARVYQPIVSNPKSTAQMQQRAKANLAGRLSAITPKDAIAGLGSNGRERRGAFLSNILLKATNGLENNLITAKLQPADLLFSKGVDVPVITFSSININTQGLMTMNFKRTGYASQNAWNKAGGMFVAVVVDPVTGNYDFVQTELWNKVDFPEADVNLTQQMAIENIGNHDIFVYFVPYSINENKGSTRTNGLGIDAAAYVASVGITNAASNLIFGYSLYAGKAIPAQAVSHAIEKKK